MDEGSDLLQLRREFSDFLDQDEDTKAFLDQARSQLEDSPSAKACLRLELDVHRLQAYSPDLHRRLLDQPEECIRPMQEALHELLSNQLAKLQDSHQLHVGFTGEFGPHCVSPRQLTSAFISRLVNVQGIVTKCSLVHPKVVKSVHYCEKTGQFSSKEYRDVTSTAGLPTNGVYPSRDEGGNVLSTEFGLCVYKNHQMVTVQEIPETAPPGQLPRSAEVILEDDLVDSCKPGDRISVVGVYKAVPPRAQGSMSGSFRAVVVATCVKPLLRDAATARITAADIQNADALAAQADLLDQLGNSLAPSIYGHQTIKKALVLLLVGGAEKNLENGTHLRGDVNCLLLGDPGVAKSQLLRAVMHVAPLAVSTTGRGSSGVGLTAAVTQDSETGERRLEAGAMVLADRGVVCIDEFDKMNDIDRVAIHEVMEQQTVTIAKAGIQTSLNARCSVVAAANPLYGTYDHSMSITRNVNLPDSLLSRFDLLFIVLDNLDAQRDLEIATHVLGQHCYRQAGDDGRKVEAVQARLDTDIEETGGDTEMYVKYDRKLHGERDPNGPHAKEPLTTNFFKKYITIAKRRGAKVALTDEASDAIREYYGELRGSSDTRALPVTVRTLETIIRLSTAAAKVRFSAAVEKRDVDLARGIMNTVLSCEADPEAAPPASPARARAKPSGQKRAREQAAEPQAGAAAAQDEDEEMADAAEEEEAVQPSPALAQSEEDSMGAPGGSNAENIDPNATAAVHEQAVRVALRELFLQMASSGLHKFPVASLMDILAAKRQRVPLAVVNQLLTKFDQEDHVPGQPKILWDGTDIYQI